MAIIDIIVSKLYELYVRTVADIVITVNVTTRKNANHNCKLRNTY